MPDMKMVLCSHITLKCKRFVLVRQTNAKCLQLKHGGLLQLLNIMSLNLFCMIFSQVYFKFFQEILYV
jgi:hypothetical protein